MKLYRNFLNKKDFNLLSSSLIQRWFPWHLTQVLPEKKIECDEKNNIQFSHLFYADHQPVSQHMSLLQSLLKKIEPKAILKIKANLTIRTKEKVAHGFHIDSNYDNTTAILYLNNNNGETIFENGEKIKSKANTLITFPSKMKHTGTTNTCNEKYRMVLNLNYF